MRLRTPPQGFKRNLTSPNHHLRLGSPQLTELRSETLMDLEITRSKSHSVVSVTHHLACDGLRCLRHCSRPPSPPKMTPMAPLSKQRKIYLCLYKQQFSPTSSPPTTSPLEAEAWPTGLNEKKKLTNSFRQQNGNHRQDSSISNGFSLCQLQH